MMDAFRQDLIQKIGANKFALIEKTQIGIAGAGGLGSNCAACLVRVGFKHLTIVDFDRVEPANLDRQFYFEDQVGMEKVEALGANLCRINPQIQLQLLSVKLDAGNLGGIFQGCDIVVECLDRAESKSMLVNVLRSQKRCVVAASGLGGYGSTDAIRVHRLKSNFILVGDLNSDIESAPALSPRVSVAAAKQADVVLELVIGNPS